MKPINKEKYFFLSIVIFIASFVVMIGLINLNIRVFPYMSLFVGLLLSLHVYNFARGGGIINDLFRIEDIKLESFNLLNLSFALTRTNNKYEVVVFPSIDFYTLFDQIAGIDNTLKKSVGRRYIPSHLQIRIQIESIDRYEVSENLIDAMYNIKKSSYPFSQTRPASKIGEVLYRRVQGLGKDISISDNLLYITIVKASGKVYLVALLDKYSIPDDFLKTFDFLDKIKDAINRNN